MINRNNPTRLDSTGEFMTERLLVNGPDKMFLDEVLHALKEAGATDVYIHAGSFSWVRPATTEELEDWKQIGLEHDRRTEKWEREMLIRLKEKYED